MSVTLSFEVLMHACMYNHELKLRSNIIKYKKNLTPLKTIVKKETTD